MTGKSRVLGVLAILFLALGMIAYAAPVPPPLSAQIEVDTTVVCWDDYTHVVEVSWLVVGGTAPYAIHIVVSHDGELIDSLDTTASEDVVTYYVSARGGGTLSASIKAEDGRSWLASSEVSETMQPCPTFGREYDLPRRFKLFFGSQRGGHEGGSHVIPEIVPGLDEFDNGTVFLKGFAFEFEDDDHKLNRIGLEFGDIRFDPAGKYLAWDTSLVLGDGGPDPFTQPYRWEYEYAVLAFVEGAARVDVVGTTTMRSNLGWAMAEAELEVSENAFAIPNGFWFYYAGSYEEFGWIDRPRRMKLRSIASRPMYELVSDGVISWGSVFDLDDGNNPAFSTRTEYTVFESPEVVIIHTEREPPFYVCGSGGVQQAHMEVELPEGVEGATVLLRGWELDFLNEARQVRGLGIRLKDENFDSATNVLSWDTEVAFYDDSYIDGPLGSPYQWRCWYTIVGFRRLEISEKIPNDPVGQLPVTLKLKEGGTVLESDMSIFSGVDEDEDTLNDDWEAEAARQLSPYFRLDEREDWLFNSDRHPVVCFSAVHLHTLLSPSYVVISYVIAWARDYGTAITGFNSHNGDTERVVMAWKIVDDRTVRLEWVFFSAHESLSSTTHWDGSSVHAADSLEYYNSRLVVCTSHGKHANFLSCSACEDYSQFNENCCEAGLFRFPTYYLQDALFDYPVETCEGEWELCDLAELGFPGETIIGMSDDGDWHSNFCGGLGWDGDCAKAVDYWLFKHWMPGSLGRLLAGWGP